MASVDECCSAVGTTGASFSVGAVASAVGTKTNSSVSKFVVEVLSHEGAGRGEAGECGEDCRREVHGCLQR